MNLEATVLSRGASGNRILVTILFIVAALTASVAAQVAVEFEEIGGTLPDGTVYLIRVPKNWNKTVINDLDYARNPDADFRMYWLKRGYATSGTQRHALRQFLYDPLQEVYNQVRVLDLLEAQFGRPDRVIQYGQSGGGLVALGLAEVRPDRVNGVISACFQTPIPVHSMRLDMFFTLRALIAPDSDLTIVDIPDDFSSVEADWREVVTAAQQTAQGRARIALAMMIGQHPAWTDPSMPEPDPGDFDAVQEAMFHSIVEQVIPQNFRSRQRNENAGGGVYVWNTGIDYEKFFNNGDEPHQELIRTLYRKAALDLQADLAQINQSPRIAADLDIIDEFWRVSPRTLNGDPQVPIFQFGTTGDQSSPQGQMQGYEARVRAQGKGHLYRQAVVHAAGHCRFTVSERATAVETMMRRLDIGHWPSTNPEPLNALAKSLNLEESRFIHPNWPEFNRAFFLDSEVDR